jgi:hypothetical protein
MADNWVHGGPKGLVDASYVWLPIKVSERTPAQLKTFFSFAFPSQCADGENRIGELPRQARDKRTQGNLKPKSQNKCRVASLQQFNADNITIPKLWKW